MSKTTSNKLFMAGITHW